MKVKNGQKPPTLNHKYQLDELEKLHLKAILVVLGIVSLQMFVSDAYDRKIPYKLLIYFLLFAVLFKVGIYKLFY